MKQCSKHSVFIAVFFSFECFFFISVRMFGECIWQYSLKEFMTATCLRLEEEEEGGSYLMREERANRNNPPPLFSHFGYYDTVLVLKICNFFFCSWKKKKKGMCFSMWLWGGTVVLQPVHPVHALCTGGVRMSVSWRYLFRDDKGSLTLIHGTLVCML